MSPIRNESAHLDETIAAVVSQTIKPTEWVLVDDGSTDESGSIIDAWAMRIPWIKVIHRQDRGGRSQGTGVMEAFYDGYRVLTTSDWEFLVKLDGDIVVGASYFEECFAKFDHEPRLGIGGGTVDHVDGGIVKTERSPEFHVRGATKIYRRACWDQLGGLMKSPRLGHIGRA